MNKSEAEEFVYQSFLKAAKYQNYYDKDSLKRNPELFNYVIRRMCDTPSVVITGSKGKGSVANMISQIIQTKIKAGLMTSPHIIDFCERFKVNGKNISDRNFVKHMERLVPMIKEMDKAIPINTYISPMAIQVVLALSFFKEQNTKFNIFECGKGAKYDDVNNVKHEYAVINSIFLEHTRELGESLDEIANDKSYVINGEQKCVYVAEQEKSVLEVIKARAIATNTPLKFYGTDFYATNIKYTCAGMLFDVVMGESVYNGIAIPLLGEHQAKNCAIALALAKDFLGDISISLIKKKLLKLNWPGRMEIISNNPFIILDACINRECCENVKRILAFLNIKHCCTVIGIPDDKDYLGVAKSMKEISDQIILTKSQNPHYRFSIMQKTCLMKEGYNVDWIPYLPDAIRAAVSTNMPIIILGTTSVIAEVKMLQNQRAIIIAAH